mmetsp:Transcript_12734/g.32042  ORF Transcript_12734/g.32042 Transcript_12734/m.32042 type:complete len:103 (+) Transcript_12734:205-513(+)
MFIKNKFEKFLIFFFNKKNKEKKIEIFFEKLMDDFIILERERKIIGIREEYFAKAVFLKTQKIIKIFQKWNISQKKRRKNFSLKPKKQMLFLQKKLMDKIVS